MGFGRQLTLFYMSVIGTLAFASALSAACSDTRVNIAGNFGQVNVTVSVADDAQERARGLMFVDQMPLLEGMLFVYDAPQPAQFWMKNTLIPLDMLFVGSDGVIRSIHENAIPGDLAVIDGGEGIKFVLELNGGLTRRLGITVGDSLQHPAIGMDAKRPCDA
jgi:hypothetical protein